MLVYQIISPADAREYFQSTTKLNFNSGKLTANGLASESKINQEISVSDESARKLINSIFNNLIKSAWIKNRFLPKFFTAPIINKYEAGDQYGRHFDGSHLQHGTQNIRADLSYTLMLSSATEYVGGDLVVEEGRVKHKVRLDAGQILIYPSLRWHEVTQVTQGVRVAAVGWIESAIKNPEKRELLSLLEDFRLDLQNRVSLSDAEQLRLGYLQHRLQHALSD